MLIATNDDPETPKAPVYDLLAGTHILINTLCINKGDHVLYGPSTGDRPVIVMNEHLSIAAQRRFASFSLRESPNFAIRQIISTSFNPGNPFEMETASFIN